MCECGHRDESNSFGFVIFWLLVALVALWVATHE